MKNSQKKFKVCPFEFSLDVSLISDCIICDYNYVFDPRVFLKRYFFNPDNDFTFLIDEAHNLVDRAREMFSAGIFKKPVLKLKREFKTKKSELSKCFNKINAFMINARKACDIKENKCVVQDELPDELIKLLRKIIHISDYWLLKNKKNTKLRNELLEFYFDAQAFIKISEFYDEKYVTYFEKFRNNVKIKLFCRDPSYLLQKALKRGKSAVFFSATLTPLEYFKQISGGEEDSFKLKLTSPFPKKKSVPYDK